MTPKDPFLEGTFWDKFWRPLRSRALLFTPEFQKFLTVVHMIFLGAVKITSAALKGRNASKIQHQYW